MSDTVLKLLKEDGTLHTSKRFRALHDGMLDLTGCSNRMFKQQEVSLVRDSRHAQQLPMLSALGKATWRFTQRGSESDGKIVKACHAMSMPVSATKISLAPPASSCRSSRSSRLSLLDLLEKKLQIQGV